MIKVKFGVAVFPGSNCDEDMCYTLSTLLGQEAVKIWHKEQDLQGCKVIIIPGGFAYGDYLRAGAITRFSPIMKSVADFAKKGGFVYGICNGFQILTESGLLDGTLLRNQNSKYICKNIYLKSEQKTNILTKNLDSNRAYKIPIGNGEGRFFAPDETLKRLNGEGQILFRYCNERAEVADQYNPNGSSESIAGISNKEGNVVAMMPHPERSANPLFGNTDGADILKNMIENLV
jgi:phosphoribosylformylglycinamidine synthase subunit PurQ / glutaminase